jgi:hypothetical protein
MKILSATVTDPRRGGEYRNPYLTITVDERISETDTPKTFGGPHTDWKVVPHGPFVAVDIYKADVDGGRWEAGDLGLFNTSGFWKDRLVEVTVCEPGNFEIDLAMSLNRARRLIRKYDISWRYTMDDIAGQHGKVLWRLMPHGLPTCIKCDKNFREEVYYRGTHLPLCDTHLSEHNKLIRNLRTRTA